MRYRLAMKFADIHAKVGHLQFTIERNARMLYDRIIDEGVEHVLELGIAYGKATCYIAAALDELGRGRIDAVDLVSAKDFFDPCAEDLLKSVGLDAYVNIYRMQSGYTWFLHDAIKRATHEGVCEPQYDLAIIDGPKNWTIDGAAFFMTDKLLRQGGTLIFDDYAWTYAEAASRGSATTDGISHRSMSSEEMNLPQIHEVFELLVRQHPS
jgi:predicted O-methyltransferase YrrM